MGVNRLATSPAPRDITGGWSAVGESDDVVLVFDFSDSGGAATLTHPFSRTRTRAGGYNRRV